MRSLAGTSVVRITSVLATFGVGVLLARGLGVQGYGYYALALSIITIAGIPGEFGLSKLVTREVSGAAARSDDAAIFGVLSWAKRTCWRVSAVLGVAVAVAGIVLIAKGSRTLGITVLMGIPIVPFIALSRIAGGALQGLHHIIRGQIPANLLRPLFLSLLLLAAYFVGGTNAPVAMALNSISAMGVFVVAQAWLAKRRPAMSPPAVVQSPRAWLASTIPLALTDAMWMLQVELTTVLLGVTTNPAGVGLFRIAVGTAAVAAAPLVVIVHTTMPMIARLHAEGDRKRLQKVVTYGACLQTAGVLILSLPLLVAPELLLSLVFGSPFSTAATPLRMLAFGQIISAAFGPNVLLLNMTHQEKRVTRAMMVAVAVNATVVIVLGSLLGAVGAALGFLASALCWNLLTWHDARHILRIETSVLGFAIRK